MFRKWFRKDGRIKTFKTVELSPYGGEEENSKYYFDGRYGRFGFSVVIYELCAILIENSSFDSVLPRDGSVIFGEKTHQTNDEKFEQHLDWLYELEENNSRSNSASGSTEVDLCCCPFLKITSKSLKSKK